MASVFEAVDLCFIKLEICSHEVVWVELVVPLRLVVGVVHGEGVVVDAVVVPLAVLVKHEHLLRVRVRVHHVQVQALVLLEEWPPGCSAPVVVFGDRDHLADWHVRRFDTRQLQSIKLEKTSFGIELHAQNEALWSEASLDQERQQ